MTLKKGILIVLEGVDGSGKTTQAKILLGTLRSRGYDAVYFREPSRGKWGKMIKEKALYADSLSPEEELALFHKDRKENVERNLKPALARKQVVILDRYYFSTIAYQGARGIDPAWIRRINEEFAVKPDLVFILDIEAKKGLKRIEDRKRKDRLFEREDYLDKVRGIFKGMKGKNIVHIDGRRSAEKISQEIEKKVFDYIE
ncbi:MAG: dTMP kinase [Candidatus Aminicenantes bacterium]